MSTVSNILLEKEILLESGTNELEVLVFTISNCTFGINVAKVREVLPKPSITRLPKTHPSVLGTFQLRDRVIPCINLKSHLRISENADQNVQDSTLILTDFNNLQSAFVVDTVQRIHRISWENVLAVPTLDALAQTPVTAVASIEGCLVLMLDFEMISDQITEHASRIGAIANPLNLPREELRVLVADDSPTVRQAVGTTLRASGYTNLQIFENGGCCWQWIEQQLNSDNEDTVADLLISDVEMPQVDGFHLTLRIKEHPRLKHIPVLLYSSIVSPDNRKKGEAVGADAQIAKPELMKVVSIADELIVRSQKANDTLVAVTETQEPGSDNETASQAPVTTPAPTAPTPAVTAPTTPPSQDSAKVGHPGSDYEPFVDVVWHTFRHELATRANELSAIFQKALGGHWDIESVNEVNRTLHSVKSASMVVPVDQITHATHKLESEFAKVRDNDTPWPLDMLEQFIQWVTTISESEHVLPPILNECPSDLVRDEVVV